MFKWLVNFIRYLRLKKCKSSCMEIQVECSSPTNSTPPTEFDVV